VYLRTADPGNRPAKDKARGLPPRRTDIRPAKGPAVIDDHPSEDIRSLFDWRSASQDGGQASPSPVGNDDLALALSLLSCNSRDREQFRGAAASA
jgi:hypothetical protein